MTAVADRTVGHVADQSAYVVLRDIVRGGLAGTITGVIVAGVGGRLVMQFAAAAVPDAAGRLTENGNRIGAITLEGTFFLVLFGVIIGLIVGAMWVALSPMIPWTGLRRAAATVPLAIALGGIGLVSGDNPDFVVLQHAPFVVLILLLLGVGAVGFVVPLMDDWLERKLPGVNGASARFSPCTPRWQHLVRSSRYRPCSTRCSPPNTRDPSWMALVVSGATLAWWVLRLRGYAAPPRNLMLVGRASLLAIVILGTVDLAPEVSQALGAS